MNVYYGYIGMWLIKRRLGEEQLNGEWDGRIDIRVDDWMASG